MAYIVFNFSKDNKTVESEMVDIQPQSDAVYFAEDGWHNLDKLKIEELHKLLQEFKDRKKYDAIQQASFKKYNDLLAEHKRVYQEIMNSLDYTAKLDTGNAFIDAKLLTTTTFQQIQTGVKDNFVSSTKQLVNSTTEKLNALDQFFLSNKEDLKKNVAEQGLIQASVSSYCNVLTTTFNKAGALLSNVNKIVSAIPESTQNLMQSAQRNMEEAKAKQRSEFESQKKVLGEELRIIEMELESMKKGILLLPDPEPLFNELKERLENTISKQITEITRNIWNWWRSKPNTTQNSTEVTQKYFRQLQCRLNDNLDIIERNKFNLTWDDYQHAQRADVKMQQTFLKVWRRFWFNFSQPLPGFIRWCFECLFDKKAIVKDYHVKFVDTILDPQASTAQVLLSNQ